MQMLIYPTSERQFIMYEALRKGATVEELFERTQIKHYFIEQMKELVEEEEALLANKGKVPEKDVLRKQKRWFFRPLSGTDPRCDRRRDSQGKNRIWYHRELGAGSCKWYKR